MNPSIPQYWEYQQDLDRTPKRFRAFSLFRDLGKDVRTVARAWAAYKGIPYSEYEESVREHVGRKQVPGYFREMAINAKWMERAIAYDAFLDRKQIETFTKEENIKHKRKLEIHRQKQEHVGSLMTSQAIEVLKVAKIAMGEYYTINDPANPSDITLNRVLDIREIYNLCRIAKELGLAGKHLTSESLGINQILLELEKLDFPNIEEE